MGLAGAGDVDDAVAAAREAQPAWAALSPNRRAAVLFRLADLLEAHAGEAAELAALDNGTPVSVMQPGRYTAAWVRYYAGWCDKLGGETLAGGRTVTSVRLEPYGVVAVIPPWNGSMMGMGQKAAPALAAGNAVVAKPPELAPFGVLRFAELAAEAGLPPGVLNVVVGGATAGAALAGHAGVDKISFTGGSATARALMATAAAHLTPLALELGGKSPAPRLPRRRPRPGRLGGGPPGGGAPLRPGLCPAHPDLRPRATSTTRWWPRWWPRSVRSRWGTRSTRPPWSARWSARRPWNGSSGSSTGPGPTAPPCWPGARGWAGSWPTGGSWPRPCSVMWTTGATWPATRSSARSWPSFGSTPRTRRWPWPTTVPTAWPPTSTPPTPAASSASSGSWTPGTVLVNGMGRISPAAPFGGTKQSGFGREGGRAGIEEMVQTKTVYADS